MIAAPRRAWDALVVGAGPAGAFAARQIASAGARVLLVEKAAFPRDKACGSCINADALATLERAGLAGLLREAGAVPLSSAHLAARGTRARIDLPAGAVLSRAVLDAALLREAIKAGAEFWPEVTALSGRCAADCRVVELRSSNGIARVEASVVISAHGLGGSPWPEIAGPRRSERSLIGAGWIAGREPHSYAMGTVYLACSRAGYAGVVRLEDGRLDVACALDPRALKRRGDVGSLAAEILEVSGLPPIPSLAQGAWRGTPALGWRARRVAAERLFLIGDAAGFAEPFTGQGIAWALTSAELVVPLVLRAVQPESSQATTLDLAEEWERVYSDQVRNKQRACTWIGAALRHPWLAGAWIACSLALRPPPPRFSIGSIDRRRVPANP